MRNRTSDMISFIIATAGLVLPCYLTHGVEISTLMVIALFFVEWVVLPLKYKTEVMIGSLITISLVNIAAHLICAYLGVTGQVEEIIHKVVMDILVLISVLYTAAWSFSNTERKLTSTPARNKKTFEVVEVSEGFVNLFTEIYYLVSIIRGWMMPVTLLEKVTTVGIVPVICAVIGIYFRCKLQLRYNQQYTLNERYAWANVKGE